MTSYPKKWPYSKRTRGRRTYGRKDSTSYRNAWPHLKILEHRLHLQVHVYKQYLESEQCHAILRGNYKVFVGLITLRKICNHPDLASGGPRIFKGDKAPKDKEMEFGYFKRSGKLIVVDALLKLWKKQGILFRWMSFVSHGEAVVFCSHVMSVHSIVRVASRMRFCCYILSSLPLMISS